MKTEDSTIDFEKYLSAERDAFVIAINSNDWNTKVRTAAEDFLICFDQLRERVQSSNEGEVKTEEEVLKATCDIYGTDDDEHFVKKEAALKAMKDFASQFKHSASHSCTIKPYLQGTIDWEGLETACEYWCHKEFKEPPCPAKVMAWLRTNINNYIK